MASLLLLQHTLTLDASAWNPLLPDTQMANYLTSSSLHKCHLLSEDHPDHKIATPTLFSTLHHQTWVTFIFAHLLICKFHEGSDHNCLLFTNLLQALHSRSSLHIWRAVNWSLGFCNLYFDSTKRHGNPLKFSSSEITITREEITITWE